MELVKSIVRLGNSAGVVLPKEWLHGEAKITLLKKPENPKKEVLNILEPYLSSVLGVYIVGSYARGEQSRGSDVDVLAITTDISRHMRQANYDITFVSKDNLKATLEDNILPLLPMIMEASAVINAPLLAEYRKTPITKHNLKWHIETTKSALKLAHISLQLAKENKDRISDNIAYSLVLRLRGAHIVDFLMKNKKTTTATLRKLIEDVTGSLEIYNAYQRSKAGLRAKKVIPLKEVEALHSNIVRMIAEQEKWIKRNG